MSSRRAMRQAQKQAFAKHRSNITNSRFDLKKKNLINKKKKKVKGLALFVKLLNFFTSRNF